jgi:lysophospholipase L1-like esterase
MPDHLHFTPEGYRELGKRYAVTMLPLLRLKAVETK